MFIYTVKIEGACAQLHGLCNWIVQQMLKSTSVLCDRVVVRHKLRLWVKTAATINQQYTATWEIVKLKACYCLKNYSLLQEQPFKPYLQLRGTLLNKIYAVEIQLWQKFLPWLIGRLMNVSLPEAKAYATSLCFSNNFLDPILSLSNIRALSNSTTWTCA